MSTYDSEANTELNAWVSRGGSVWVGLSTTVPTDDPSSITEAPIARAQLPLNGSTTWQAAADRSVQPKADLSLGTATETFVPAGLVFWSAATGGTPLKAARVGDIVATAGSEVTLPAAALTLTVP